MDNTRKKLLIIIGGLLVGIIGIVGVFAVTSKPQFCSTCHYIEPYVTSWEESVHTDINCVKCHAEPGAIGLAKRKAYSVKELVGHVRGTRPGQVPTNLPNKNCLQSGCHSEAKLEEGQRFNHGPHFGENGVNCIHCHSGVGHSKEIANIGLIGTDEVCLKCHGR